MDPHREIELKLSIAPGDAARVLEHPIVRTAAVADAEVQHLHSVYFDSRDLALAGQGISLRLRRGGGRQWQTLKFGDQRAAGLFARAEFEVELDGERPNLAAIPDEAARERVVDALAGQALEPIFETEMERTHQRLADETCEWSLDLDRGEVRAGFARESICELELELHRGSPSRLFEIALTLSDAISLWPGTRSKADRGYSLRTGERPVPTRAVDPELAGDATVRDAIVPIARSCLAQIGDNAEFAFEGVDPEGVHQMRIGLRRMRSLITLFRRELPSTRLGRLRGPLRWLAGLLGEVRDLDVLLAERIEPLVRRRSGDLAMQRLREEAIALREERRLVLREALRSRRHAHLMLELGHWIASLEELDLTALDPSAPLVQRADAFAENALARLDRKARRLAPVALDGPPTARHDLRIALKRLRYGCEFFRSLYASKEASKDAKRYVRRLSRLQDLLGVQNDIDAAERLIQVLLDRCAPERAVEFARAAGFIEGFGVRDQERALRKFSERWVRFEGTRAFWVRED